MNIMTVDSWSYVPKYYTGLTVTERWRKPWAVWVNGSVEAIAGTQDEAEIILAQRRGEYAP